MSLGLAGKDPQGRANGAAGITHLLDLCHLLLFLGLQPGHLRPLCGLCLSLLLLETLQLSLLRGHGCLHCCCLRIPLALGLGIGGCLPPLCLFLGVVAVSVGVTRAHDQTPMFRPEPSPMAVAPEAIFSVPLALSFFFGAVVV